MKTWRIDYEAMKRTEYLEIFVIWFAKKCPEHLVWSSKYYRRFLYKNEFFYTYGADVGSAVVEKTPLISPEEWYLNIYLFRHA